MSSSGKESLGRVVSLISGGLDSVTLAYHLKSQGYELTHLLSFDYSQRHRRELAAAELIVRELDVPWHLINLRGLNPLIGGSALTDKDVDVPEGHYSEDNMKITVVPNRNAIMLSIAWGVAVADKADFVAIAVHAGDHAIYPDCRPEFYTSLQVALRSGTEGFGDIRFNTPFLHKTKADIVRQAHDLDVPVAWTWSCYKGGSFHCGRCSTCVERAEAFSLAGVPDPTKYEDPDYWHEAVTRHSSSS